MTEAMDGYVIEKERRMGLEFQTLVLMRQKPNQVSTALFLLPFVFLLSFCRGQPDNGGRWS